MQIMKLVNNNIIIYCFIYIRVLLFLVNGCNNKWHYFRKRRYNLKTFYFCFVTKCSRACVFTECSGGKKTV